MTEHIAACDGARKPLLEIRDRFDFAKSEERAAETALEKACSIETDAVVNGGDARKAADAVAKATSQLDRCRRVSAALEQKRAALEDSLRSAELTASIAASAGEAVVCNVLEEIADDMLANLTEVGKRVAIAEATVRTLAAYAQKRGWLPSAERIIIKLNRLQVPSWTEQPFPQWDKLVADLFANANATLPAVQS